MIRKISLIVLVVFFLTSGINHFRDPGFYYPLIPDYLPFPGFINIASGILEIALGLGIILPISRQMAAKGMIILLLAFVPSHIYFIQLGGCVSAGLCVPAWTAWVRLALVHPLLILWVWYHRR